MTRLNRAIEKLSSAREIEQNKGFKKSNNSSLRPAGFGPNEEIKGIDFDNLDSSLELGSHKSVSDSEESKKDEVLSVETTLHNALFCHSKQPRRAESRSFGLYFNLLSLLRGDFSKLKLPFRCKQTQCFIT